MFGKAGLGGLMQQAQKMQEKMKQAQAELGNIEVVGEAGAGMVKITMTCLHHIRRIYIDDALLADAADDKEMLEDLLSAAFNDAARKVEAATQAHMGQFTQGLNLPAGMDNFFR